MIALGVLIVACGPASDEPTPRENSPLGAVVDESGTLAERFDALALASIADDRVQGVQYALIEKGVAPATQAFGLADRENGVPMTTATPINVASISKSFTAWGVVSLLESKGLELDVSARELLSDEKLYAAVFGDLDVSVHMLLSHGSGLSGASVPVTPAVERLPSVEDILLGRSTVSRPRLVSSPGQQFHYSGAGYLVLQQLIENQSGKPFAQYMQETVLAPAELADSTFVLDPGTLDRVSVYYRANGRRREPYHLAGAAGGLYATADDMATFVSMYTAEGRELREKILSNDAFEAMTRPTIRALDGEGRPRAVHYALGHYTYQTSEGVPVLFHTGGNPGLRSIYLVVPERSAGFFAVANSDNGSELLAAMLTAFAEHHGLSLHDYF